MNKDKIENLKIKLQKDIDYLKKEFPMGYLKPRWDYYFEELLEAILEDDRRNLCKCGSEIKIGSQHHCKYVSGVWLN